MLTNYTRKTFLLPCFVAIYSHFKLKAFTVKKINISLSSHYLISSTLKINTLDLLLYLNSLAV